MAHQLDFQITIWSDDKDLLLGREKLLRLLSLAEKPPGGGDDYVCYFLSQILLGLHMHPEKLEKLEVHSIDINWDDGEEGSEPEYVVFADASTPGVYFSGFIFADRMLVPDFNIDLGEAKRFEAGSIVAKATIDRLAELGYEVDCLPLMNPHKLANIKIARQRKQRKSDPAVCEECGQDFCVCPG